MPKFLDTRGLATLGIGICGRCSKKFSLTRLSSDPNAPGLRVCDEGCKDLIDPYRLAPRAPDTIVLLYPRPDRPLYPGPVLDPVLPLQAAIEVTNYNVVSLDGALGSGNPDEAIKAGILTDAVSTGVPDQYLAIYDGGPYLGTGTVGPAPEDITALIGTGESQSVVTNENGILGVEEATPYGVAAAPPVTAVKVTRAWAPNTYYQVGANVTPVNPVGMDAVGLTLYTFTCILPGLSGISAPDWTTFPGTGVSDNQVMWLNAGLYQP